MDTTMKGMYRIMKEVDLAYYTMGNIRRLLKETGWRIFQTERLAFIIKLMKMINQLRDIKI